MKLTPFAQIVIISGDMEVFMLLFIACISFLIGIIVTLILQYYILYSYFKKSPVVKPPERQSLLDYRLPESLKQQIQDDASNIHNNTSFSVSLILQFLFHELRHSEVIKRWLFKKLSLEFEELLTKTVLGKFFDVINIKDMNLGNHFPNIKNISIEEVKLDNKEGHIETISLCLELDYTGSFLLSIDAKMKFGKTAYLSIKVNKISGLARLQFSRQPYTHWSFSFCNDPIIELGVESHFQGRQLQSNITNIIINQIKKTIKRKHTLPNYKIRYKPFFIKTDPSQLDVEDSEIIPQGLLEVTCIEVTRLEVPSNVQNIYFTIAADITPWICVFENDDKTSMILEITITKLQQAQLGVIFKQELDTVVVESVSQHSCAARSGLKPGDIVLAVENKIVSSVPQVAKLIKTGSSNNVTLRVERRAEFYQFKYKPGEKIEITCSSDTEETAELIQRDQDSFVIVENVKKENIEFGKKTTKCGVSLEKMKTPEKLSKMVPGSENVSKFAQTLGNFTLRKRKISGSDKSSSSDNLQTKTTPNSSGPGTPQHTSFKQNSLNTPLVKRQSITEEIESVEVNSNVEIFKSKELIPNSVLAFNEDFQFHLKDGMKYLNVDVWGSVPNDKDILLGYANIPLSHVLHECYNCVLGHYTRSYSFLPSTIAQPPTSSTHPLMSHSGFEHVFCYGDILLSFAWSHDGNIEVKRKISEILNQNSKPIELSTTTKHDFIRTQFHRATHCDFCSKKIWLKDAVQCRECGLCCHKKCIVKCQINTGCIPSNKNPESLQPGITMTEPCVDLQTEAYFDGNFKKSNSKNLSIPGSNFSKSLPPSPQRTPSRKQSSANINPFALCPGALEDVVKKPSEASEIINRLLEQVMLCPPDEFLMDSAKESGRQLYTNIPHEEKSDKINFMMSELKKTLDGITNDQMELNKQMATQDSDEEKTKYAFLIGQTEAKVHGLSVLMLHYCSSLQHTQENK